MEKYRRIILLAALAVLAVVSPRGRVYATGGDSFDAPAPSLGDSLDFLPGKSLGEIFIETTAPASEKEPPDFDKEVLKISERLRREPAAPLVAVADGLLAQARQNYSSGGDWCNLLHDVRDVLTGSAENKAAAADYIKWRVGHKTPFTIASKKSSDEERTPTKATASTVDLEKDAREASGPLRAHWLYLIGAATY